MRAGPAPEKAIARRPETTAGSSIAVDGACALCLRALGRKVEWHHVVPKSRGGKATVPLHPICHRAIHHAADNKTLAKIATIDGVRALPELQPFLKWIANKPPDFHAPTRGRKG